MTLTDEQKRIKDLCLDQLNFDEKIYLMSIIIIHWCFVL